MAGKNSMWVLIGVFVISAWILGSVVQAGAEIMNFKFYTWGIKGEMIEIPDVEGHVVGLGVRGSFLVSEDGEVATSEAVIFRDFTKGAGTLLQYVTMKFQDGSTIILKSQGMVGGPDAKWESQIIKGTGRFQGIKGTGTSKAKYLPLEKGESASKGYGETTLTYTLPFK